LALGPGGGNARATGRVAGRQPLLSALTRAPHHVAAHPPASCTSPSNQPLCLPHQLTCAAVANGSEGDGGRRVGDGDKEEEDQLDLQPSTMFGRACRRSWPQASVMVFSTVACRPATSALRGATVRVQHHHRALLHRHHGRQRSRLLHPVLPFLFRRNYSVLNLHFDSLWIYHIQDGATTQKVSGDYWIFTIYSSARINI
jgi:hypothetical protein